jgi:hypothetical protein
MERLVADFALRDLSKEVGDQVFLGRKRLCRHYEVRVC